MADRIYLNVWLRDFGESNMLQLWQRVLEAFPVSLAAPGIRAISIYPFNWAEAPVFERTFGEGTSAEDAVRLASEFLHEDYAYEAEMVWDLWVPADSAATSEDHQAGEDGDMEAPHISEASEPGWRQGPVTVALACLGPLFETDASEDRADIQIRFGLDSPFLPSELDELAEEDLDYDPIEAEARTRANLQQLIGFVHRLDETLPIQRRLLWCDSGENLAEKIMKAVTKGSDE